MRDVTMVREQLSDVEHIRSELLNARKPLHALTGREAPNGPLPMVVTVPSQGAPDNAPLIL
jgi:hypothetical protein